MKKLSFEIFRFYGIPVNINLLFLILFLFIDIQSVVIIFVSVLIHEMAHAYVAHKKGYSVSEIKIGLMFGYAEIRNLNQSDSISVTIAGPLSNLILGVSSYILSLVFGDGVIFDFLVRFYEINFIFFVFNILPIYPLDGGRIVRDSLMVYGSRIGINRKKGFDISTYISLGLCVLLSILSIYLGQIILIIMFIFFIVLHLKELKIIK